MEKRKRVCVARKAGRLAMEVREQMPGRKRVVFGESEKAQSVGASIVRIWTDIQRRKRQKKNIEKSKCGT